MSNARRWKVEIKHRPLKVLRNLPADVRGRIAHELDTLADNPRPYGCKKLTGYDLYSVRVGDWRIVYAIEDDRLIVVVVVIAPRGGVYRERVSSESA